MGSEAISADTFLHSRLLLFSWYVGDDGAVDPAVSRPPFADAGEFFIAVLLAKCDVDEAFFGGLVSSELMRIDEHADIRVVIKTLHLVAYRLVDGGEAYAAVAAVVLQVHPRRVRWTCISQRRGAVHSGGSAAAICLPLLPMGSGRMGKKVG
ncbi:hypothetical protein SCHPADRAFT_911640 [Schizopora paradoxa]|uniref:Uncharacterized protein n=1 Tax=Schizopora paradoxa TaxID=27342 RepID=A0A0H2QZP7_9AGAM|nr:hypothetical protein SCHPADRAFT_911640 [Schizopora paradoxa]